MDKGIPTWFEHVKSKLSTGQTIGLDFSQYPASALETRTTYFTEAEMTVKSVPNLVDAVWDERPPRPVEPVKVLAMEYAGKSSLDKQSQIADKLKDAKYEALLVTTLDDICWLTNFRGTDIEYNPVFFAYALFYPKRAAEESRTVLFINETKVAAVRDYLTEQKIEVRPYEAINEQLVEYNSTGVKVGVHVETCNAELHRLCKDVAVKSSNTIKDTKCLKNKTEQAGMIACNIRDCAAIMKYFAMLEEELRKPDHSLTEFSGARYLDNLRTEGALHQGPSFDTISSIGANGAVIHYKPEEGTCLALNNNEIYLLDSGG